MLPLRVHIKILKYFFYTFVTNLMNNNSSFEVNKKY